MIMLLIAKLIFSLCHVIFICFLLIVVINICLIILIVMIVFASTEELGSGNRKHIWRIRR